MATISIAETFGIDAKPSAVIDIPDEPHALTPEIDPDYVFTKDVLNSFFTFMIDPRNDGFMLFGPTGSGKSSFFDQAMARLNAPFVSVACHHGTEYADLIGYNGVVNGSTQFIQGPVLFAAENGYPISLEEYDRMNPRTQVLMHNIVQKKPVFIPELGRSIKYEEGFMVLATGNTVGFGDDTGGHVVNRQDVAYLDRFRKKRLGYLPHAAEISLLESAELSGLPDSGARNAMATQFVQCANAIRRLHIGHEEDLEEKDMSDFLVQNNKLGTKLNDLGKRQLEVTMSTRALRRWAYLTGCYRENPNAIHVAMDEAVTMPSREAREVMHEVVKAVFGE